VVAFLQDCETFYCSTQLGLHIALSSDRNGPMSVGGRDIRAVTVGDAVRPYGMKSRNVLEQCSSMH
jgi:hypothetical protein